MPAVRTKRWTDIQQSARLKEDLDIDDVMHGHPYGCAQGELEVLNGQRCRPLCLLGRIHDIIDVKVLLGVLHHVEISGHHFVFTAGTRRMSSA